MLSIIHGPPTAAGAMHTANDSYTAVAMVAQEERMAGGTYHSREHVVERKNEGNKIAVFADGVVCGINNLDPAFLSKDLKHWVESL